MSDEINSDVEEYLKRIKSQQTPESEKNENFFDEEFTLPPLDYESDNERESVDLALSNTQQIDSKKIRSIMEDDAPKEKPKKKSIFKSKKKKEKAKTKSKPEKKHRKRHEEEERFLLAEEVEDSVDTEDTDDINEFDENFEPESTPIADETADIVLPEIEDDDEDLKDISSINDDDKTRLFAPIVDETEDTVELDDKTREIQLDIPEGDERFELSEDLTDNSIQSDRYEKRGDDFINRLQADSIDGQMVFNGFGGSVEDVPDQISEEAAEEALFLKRKEKVRQFAIFQDNGDEDAQNESDKINNLFESHDERPRMKESDEFVGIEYSQLKDSRRVLRYLNSQRKKSLSRLASLGVMCLITIIVSISSSISTTVGGDRFLTILAGLILITLAIAVSIQSIINSFSQIKKKKITVNTAISISAILCFIQTLLMMVLYFFDKNTVSVFSGLGVVSLFLSELNNYIVCGRTLDSMKMCTGDNKDKLYSIENINDDKDIIELAKNVRKPSPRIRYSSKTHFPAHLIELCMSETSADKSMKLFLPVTFFLSIINLVIAWIISADFATGFAAFVATFTLCIPAYGSLLFQLPLRWFNRSFNKIGGMISCQEAVNELCKTNIILFESKDLFDQKACSMHGFKDFRNVRLDDAMLYAAAMVIRSGGPLTDVFDQMIVNRRDMLPQVKSFNYEEKLGISGWINGQKVIMGNRAMMVAHNIPMEEATDEDRYLISGHEIIYLAIAHKLAAMMVVDYAPNKRLAPYLKKMRNSGVTILVSNSDHNVTETMISSCYDMRLDNIKILNSTSARVFKKYNNRPKMAAKAFSIHDGTPYTFMKSLCIASVLRRAFKSSGMLMSVGVLMGFVIMLVLSILNVVCDLPAIFVIFIQLLISFGLIGFGRLLTSK